MKVTAMKILSLEMAHMKKWEIDDVKRLFGREAVKNLNVTESPISDCETELKIVGHVLSEDSIKSLVDELQVIYNNLNEYQRDLLRPSFRAITNLL